MRKVIASEFLSLDGVVEEPSWTFQFTEEARDLYKFDEFAAANNLLLGRTTYEGFAATWPGMAEETGEYGDGRLPQARGLDDPVRAPRMEQRNPAKGKRLFGDGPDMKSFGLVDSQVFGSGTIVLTHRPAERKAE